ncbi:MAG: CAP domain-containing protein [Anaerolineae bacterium]
MRRLRLWGISLALVVLTAFGPGLPAAQLQEDPARSFYNLINEARLAEGLPPLASSILLTRAAQRHAEDMATHGHIDQKGSDGSTYQQRIREAGYQAWDNGLLVNESIWAGLGTAANALNWFRERPERWEMFVDLRYREVGVGYARDEQGVNYFVIDFGSRPGVLPIFINDGAEATDDPQVAVRLTNEQAEPLGEGAHIGEAIEIRLSHTPDFDEEPWQPWEALIPWTLGSTEPGTYAVYVQFRDGAGRTTVSEDTIRLVPPGETSPEPLSLPTPPSNVESTPLPTFTPEELSETPSPTPLPTMPSTPTPESLPTETPADETQPEALTLTPVPTWTPLSEETREAPGAKEPDWPMLVVFLLQGVAWLLGIALFLRRR